MLQSLPCTHLFVHPAGDTPRPTLSCWPDDARYALLSHHPHPSLPQVGSLSHESFIYNAAMGRLDMYSFDLWNLNQCQCAYPQKGLDMCSNGG